MPQTHMPRETFSLRAIMHGKTWRQRRYGQRAFAQRLVRCPGQVSRISAAGKGYQQRIQLSKAIEQSLAFAEQAVGLFILNFFGHQESFSHISARCF